MTTGISLVPRLILLTTEAFNSSRTHGFRTLIFESTTNEADAARSIVSTYL
jgi:hypothetical protein